MQRFTFGESVIKGLARSTATIAVAVGALLAASLPARAESHALIMWIGTYANPQANLPGIDLDAKAARQIAGAIGVPAANITELKNDQLSLRAMGEAISGLAARIKAGDKVFLYYSGHGGQLPNASGGSSRKCVEGLVAHDIQIYFDRELEAGLAKLGAKASQVVMMNDSCFSGGASVKSGGASVKIKSVGRLVPKVYPVAAAKPADAPTADYQCGEAVNKDFLTKSLEVIPREGARLLYIAASADNEVSYASPEGSLATQAWAACLRDPAADSDRSGSINGEELRACAQARVEANKLGVHQRITLTGTPTLPVSFAGAANSSSLVSTTRVAPARTLQDLQAGGDKAMALSLKAAEPQLRIGHDSFEFEIETAREGYLYIFQIGSDGKGINLLFPNSIDSDNRMPIGRHAFPRPTWALRAGGPAGTNHLMALLSSEPKDYSQVAKRTGRFAKVPSTRQAVKSLIVVSTGVAAGRQGRYGTSEVVQVTEVP
jgi:hypothetical protein